MEGIINIAGAMPRIGTTTFALQLIGFLKENNYSAAYVERNPSGYIKNAVRMYESAGEDPVTGKTVCEGIDLYLEDGFSRLTAGGAPYDFIICDFGDMTKDYFAAAQDTFCKKGVPVIVAGVKANEIGYTERALEDKSLRNAAFVFNFTRKEDETEIRGLMEELGSATAFFPYTPDPFIYGAGGHNAAALEETFYTVMNHVMQRLQEGA